MEVRQTVHGQLHAFSVSALYGYEWSSFSFIHRAAWSPGKVLATHSLPHDCVPEQVCTFLRERRVFYPCWKLNHETAVVHALAFPQYRMITINLFAAISIQAIFHVSSACNTQFSVYRSTQLISLVSWTSPLYSQINSYVWNGWQRSF